MRLKLILGVAVALLLFYFFVVRRAGSYGDYVDFQTLRAQMLASTQDAESRRSAEAMLEELRQKFGERIPVKDAEQFIDEKTAGFRRQAGEILQKPENRGKTIDLEDLRRDEKASYTGNDRENVFREVDRNIDAMEAKYGRQMPLAEAEKMWQQLDREVDLEKLRREKAK